MRGSLFLLPGLLLPLVGCGGDASDDPTPDTPEGRWEQVSRDLDDLDHGSFRVVVKASFQEKPLRLDESRFDLEAGQATTRSTMHVDGEGHFVTHLRQFSGEAFMQMEDWGPLDGCWMRFGDDSPAAPMVAPEGVEPAALLALRSATLVEEGSDSDSLALEIDGESALRLLGVGGRALLAAPEQVLEARVPASLSLDESGDPVALRVTGRKVAAALPKGKDAAPLRQFLPETRGTATWKALDEPVEVSRPEDAQLVGQDGDRATPCAEPARS